MKSGRFNDLLNANEDSMDLKAKKMHAAALRSKTVTPQARGRKVTNKDDEIEKQLPIHFTISPFHHMNMGVYSLRHFDMFVSPQLCTNPFHHFTFSPLFHNFTAKRRKKAASEQQAIELFGSGGSDEEEEEKEEGEEEDGGREKEGDGEKDNEEKKKEKEEDKDKDGVLEGVCVEKRGDVGEGEEEKHNEEEDEVLEKEGD